MGFHRVEITGDDGVHAKVLLDENPMRCRSVTFCHEVDSVPTVKMEVICTNENLKVIADTEVRVVPSTLEQAMNDLIAIAKETYTSDFDKAMLFFNMCSSIEDLIKN